MSNSSLGPNPSGLCQCGCAERTPIAKKTRPGRGQVAGQPMRYVHGHNACRKPHAPERYVVDSETGCHIWQGAMDGHGYGQLRVAGKVVKAHKHYYEKKYGPVPAGHELDHFRCDRPACCNPDHVRPVPHVDNVRRSMAAKLTIEQARAIRALAAGPGGLTPLDLAEMFGVKRPTIYGVLRGRRWRESEAVAV